MDKLDHLKLRVSKTIVYLLANKREIARKDSLFGFSSSIALTFFKLKEFHMAKNAELKTKKNDASVDDFLNLIEDEQKRKDCFEIAKMMEKATAQKPRMWGPSIVGFGEYHYVYSGGYEGDMCKIGFSPRKQNLTLYISQSFDSRLMEELGKYKMSKACLYIKKLSDVDTKVLQELINEAANTDI